MLAHPVSEELLEAARQTAMQASLKATLQCANAFATTDFWPDLSSFTLPTLIIHGTSDKTVPMGGRSLGGGRFKQGDVLKSLAQLRARDGCPEEPTGTSAHGPFACKLWSADACASKREIELCLHPGEHEIDSAWVAEDYAWVDSLAKARGHAMVVPPQ